MPGSISCPTKSYFKNYYRCINVARYICQDGGHSVRETAEEFRVSRTTIQRDLNTLHEIAFGGYLRKYPKRERSFQMLYSLTMNTLKKVRLRNFSLARRKKEND